MNAIRARQQPPFGRGHPLSTLLAAREEELRLALPGWSSKLAPSGIWRKEHPLPEPEKDAQPSVDFVRLESLPFVRFTAPSLVRVCDALGLPEVDESTGEHVLVFADFSRGGPLAGDLHVIERVSDLVRDRLAWTEPTVARRLLEEDEAAARARHEKALAAWQKDESVPAPVPPPPLRIPLEAILELAKSAARDGTPLWLWSVRWADE